MQKRGHSGDSGSAPADKRPRTDPWRKPEDIPSNGGFEEYYKEQGVCPPEVRPARTYPTVHETTHAEAVHRPRSTWARTCGCLEGLAPIDRAPTRP